MPALPSVPNVLRSELVWSIGTDLQAMTRSFWHYPGSAPTATQCSGLAATINAFAVAQFIPLAHPDVALTEVLVTDLSSSSGAQGSHVGTTPGSRTGGPLPANVAAQVNHTINRRYRGGKPKSFLPLGTDTDLSSPQTWTVGFEGLFGNAWTAWQNAVIANSGTSVTVDQLVNVSYYSGFNTVGPLPDGKFKYPAKPRAAPLVDTIVGSTPRQILASQRRRLTA